MENSHLTPCAFVVLQKRYLKKNIQGQVIVTPDEMFWCVARNIAEAERFYGNRTFPEELSEIFFQMMASLDFLPSSPCLMNAGRDLQQLPARFVLPVDDSLDSIFETVKQTSLIHQSGEGTGFSFSHLSPRDDAVQSTGGIASGPVSFMNLFNMATEVIKQGGREDALTWGAKSRPS